MYPVLLKQLQLMNDWYRKHRWTSKPESRVEVLHKRVHTMEFCGAQGAFWGEDNIVYLDRGLDYTAICMHLSKRSKCTISISLQYVNSTLKEKKYWTLMIFMLQCWRERALMSAITLKCIKEKRCMERRTDRWIHYPSI